MPPAALRASEGRTRSTPRGRGGRCRRASRSSSGDLVWRWSKYPVDSNLDLLDTFFSTHLLWICLSNTTTNQGDDELHGGKSEFILYISCHLFNCSTRSCSYLFTLIPTGEDILVGDYGEVFWVDEAGNVTARAGGGGFGDFTDGLVRNIQEIYVIWPALTNINGHNTDFFDSGEGNRK